MSPELYVAGLSLTVTHPPSPGALDAGRAGLRRAARRAPHEVPACLVLDLGALLARGPGPLELPRRDLGDALQAAVTSYAEHLVARLRSAPALSELLDATAGVDPAAALSTVLGRLTARLARHEALPPGGAAATRRLLERDAVELLEASSSALERDEVRAAVASQLSRLTRAAKRQASLLEASDAFVVRHLHALADPSDQLAFEQVVDAAEALSVHVPRRVRAPRRTRGGEVTEVQEETAYPVGGYASIASYGPIENLVSSELVYLDGDAGLDLFDLRYVTGELLKYTRDEGQWTRPRRRVELALTAGALEQRVKLPGLPYQLSVLAQACLIVAVDRLVEWLGAHALSIRVLAVDPDGAHEAERARLALALGDPVARGLVEVVRVDRLAEADPGVDRLVVGAQRDPAQVRIAEDGRCLGPGGREAEGLAGWGALLTEALRGCL